MRRYEGMFLFDNTVAHDWKAVEQEVRRLCERIGATLQVCLKFDERKLFYEIKRRKRGTYVLAYFDADPSRIVDLERDARLSEVILRALVLRSENATDEKLAELRSRPADQPLQPVSGEFRRGEEDAGGREQRGGGRRDFRGGRDDRGGRDFGRGPREPEAAPVGEDEGVDAAAEV